MKDILNSKKWGSNLDIVHPINIQTMPDFSKWVMYAGFKTFHMYDKDYVSKHKLGLNHYGHDFISYLDQKQIEHNLSSTLEVRAVADGIIEKIVKPKNRFQDYETFIIIKHNEFNLASGYCHIVPKVVIGDRVKKGQIIATLYDTSLESMALPIHLHFELGNYNSQNYPYFKNMIDPLKILPNLDKLSVKKYMLG